MIVLPAYLQHELMPYSGFIQLYAQRLDGLSVSKNWDFKQNFRKKWVSYGGLPLIINLRLNKMVNRQIHIRLNGLKLALKEIEDAFRELKKDAFLEMGFEYDTPIPETPENRELHKKVDLIRRKREDILYYRIFCFTQVAFSLKDYLKKIYPLKKEEVESFFSDQIDGAIPKKDIANDLKHNPKNDMKFGFVAKSKETEIVNRSKITTIKYDFNWNYRGLDTVDHCKTLFQQIHQFVRDEIDQLPKEPT